MAKSSTECKCDGELDLKPCEETGRVENIAWQNSTISSEEIIQILQAKKDARVDVISWTAAQILSILFPPIKLRLAYNYTYTRKVWVTVGWWVEWGEIE